MSDETPPRAGGGTKAAIALILIAVVAVVFFYRKDILDTSRGQRVASDEKTAPATARIAHIIDPDTGLTCPARRNPDRKRIVIGKSKDVPTPRERFVVLFFHSGEQCSCSEAIETGAYEALVRHFPADLTSGRLEWQKRDVANPLNWNFAEAYKLQRLDDLHDGLVLVKVTGDEGGRWRKLSDAVFLKDTEEEYIAYVQREVLAFMQGVDLDELNQKGAKPKIPPC
jgi:hypothetical protein